MPSHGVPIGLTQLVGDLRRDLARAARAASRQATGMEIPFSQSGSVVTGTSQLYTPPMDVYLTEVRCLLGTVGGGTTVVTVYVNGTSQGTVTCNSGNVSATFAVALAGNTDVLTVAVTTADATAKDLTVLARFS